MRLAVAGKGGSGKSFVAGTLARVLARQGRRVLVLDSDPMPGLGISLGMGPMADDMLAGAVERGEDDRWRLRKGIGAARAVQQFSATGPDGVRLLQFGKPDHDGLGPIMGSLNGFTQVVHRLARDGVLAGWTIIGDLPAGPRQTAYNWAPYAERFLVVVEPTWQSVLTGRRVSRLAAARGTAGVAVVVNKVRDAADVEFVGAEVGMAPLAAVPADPTVRDADRSGVAPIDAAPGAPAVVAVRDLADRLTEPAGTVAGPNSEGAAT